MTDGRPVVLSSRLDAPQILIDRRVTGLPVDGLRRRGGLDASGNLVRFTPGKTTSQPMDPGQSVTSFAVDGKRPSGRAGKRWNSGSFSCRGLER